MDLIVFITSTIVFLYSIMILILIAGFYKVPEETYKTEAPVNDFSIIVPFRNEEENLEKLIESLMKIEYPQHKFEIILVNDNSDDNSLEIAERLQRFTNLNLKVITLTEEMSGKKSAISFGIRQAMFPWIITTDADCYVQPLWLKLFDQKLEDVDALMLAGPVNMISTKKGFIDTFQQCDLAAMMGSTIGGFGLGKPFLCNGANLLFNKAAFFEVEGYKGNISIASGDDLFLMEKFIKKFPKKVKYIKASGAIVYTSTIKTVRQFIQQRIRWAAKSSSYNSLFIKTISIMVGGSNAVLLLLMLFAIFQVSVLDILPFILMKFIVDYWLIKISSSFLMNRKEIYLYPIIATVYPLYVVVVAILSQTSSYEWKGRKFNK